MRSYPSGERVYFVGAGCSSGMGYPTGGALVRDLVRYLRGAPPPKRLERVDFQSSLQGDRRSRARAGGIIATIEDVLDRYFNVPLDRVHEVSVAEFFTVAHTLAESTWLRRARDPAEKVAGASAPDEAMLFAELAATTRTYFQDISDCHAKPQRDVLSVVNRLRPGADVVVNFNWDEELDAALARRACSLEYTAPAARSEGSVLMLKPHGSIGWYDVTQGIGNSTAYFIADGDMRVQRPERRLVAYYNTELPKDIDRRRHPVLSCPPVITPPTFAKRFEYREQQCIWRDVLAACSRATEFVFLGYAMLSDDYLTRAAIRSALKGNRRRDRLRCLVVDLAYDEAKHQNFASVFGELSRRNFMKRRLGTDDGGLAEDIERALKRAVVG